MLKNYIKIAWRNLRRNKSYTIINLMGLAVGMACCILIALYIKNEYSIDRFHENANDIYAVTQTSSYWGEGLYTPYPLANAVMDEIPEVEQVVRISSARKVLVTVDDKKVNEDAALIYADPNFFQLFTFPLAQGDSQHVLDAPHTIVLTPGMASKYFKNQNPIGQTITLENYGQARSFTITGVMKDDPKNTTLNFKFVASLSTEGSGANDPDSWDASNYQTYVQLNARAKLTALEEKLTRMKNRHVGKEIETNFSIIPLTDVYLSDITHVVGFKGDVRYHYIFGAIGLFILLIACFNYMNLATAQSFQRRREVGVRKAAGAFRGQIMGQFFAEAILLSLLAFIASLLLVEMALPGFNALVSKELVFSYVNSIEFLSLATALAILTGAASAVYPAVILSRLNTASVLKGMNEKMEVSKLRKSLIAMQFMVATVLIIGTIVIFQQLSFVQQEDLGFTKANTLVVSIPDLNLSRQTEVVKQQFEQIPHVKQAAATSGVPGFYYLTYGMPVPDSERKLKPKLVSVDESYLKSLNIELIAGRNFSAARPADETGAYILNEAAVKELGWKVDEAVGKPLEVQTDGKVIGVMKNFHYASFHEKIGPVIFRMKAPYDDRYPSYNAILVALDGANTKNTLEKLRQTWNAFDPNHPFEYTFLDEYFDLMYASDRKLSQLFSVFAFLGIFIAGMGLLGLSAYTIQQRTKEIGIRKVLGATVANIVGLLSKDFLKLVALGFIIAVPIAWYAMNQWLSDFAYKIEIGPGIFLLAGSLALFIALATVSWQSIRAALANPVDSLRSE